MRHHAQQLPALVLACAAAQLPLALWLLRSYMLRVPVELEEAARLDGATWLTTLGRVILPLLRDGLGATGVLVFVLDWNLYLLPTLLAERPPHLLTVVMRDFFAFERELEWSTAAAALLDWALCSLLMARPLPADSALLRFALTAGLYPALAALFGRVHRGLADPGAA